MGSQVRVPLGGRKIRGFVTRVVDEREGKLKDILAVSGEQPVFDAELLKSLQWAANHYVAPVAVVLDKSSPPTLPGPSLPTLPAVTDAKEAPDELRAFTTAIGAGERRPAIAMVTDWRDPSWLRAAAPILGAGLTCLVIVPTVKESQLLESMSVELYGSSVVAVPDATGSTVTNAWSEANRGSRLVIGTPRVSTWKIDRLGMVIVVEEGRRAMKDRQTPTVHVRDLIRTRSRIEGFGAMFVGPTPSVELIAAGTEIHVGPRPWGLVEVVDRNEDPPGGGFLSERSIAAIRSVVASKGRTFVFTHRRAGDSSVRCTKCRALRLCRQCGSHVGNHPSCPRCGLSSGNCANCGGDRFESMGTVPSRLIAEITNRVAKGIAGEPASNRSVIVGTERDLAGIDEFDLAIAVDVDALLFGHNYRASEEALRVIARVVRSVHRGKGYRAILQTSTPQSRLIAALRRADPIAYLEGVLADRAKNGFPPATEMMAIEVRSDPTDDATSLLDTLAGSMIIGSVPTEAGHRWLLQGDLSLIKSELRTVVQKLRDSGVTVRIDVDPIDL